MFSVINCLFKHDYNVNLIKILKRVIIFLILTQSLSSHAQILKKKRIQKSIRSNLIDEEVFMDTMDVYPLNPITDYKGFTPKIFDLIHTKLILTPSFKDRTIQGEAFLRLHAHFHSQSSIIIDAKGMAFDTVSYSLDHFTGPLKYQYDGQKLTVNFPQTVSIHDTFELKIQYTAYPYNLNEEQRKFGQGSYFINSQHTNPYRHTIFWTQGEPESASCWFPTLDAPNQKCTQEITVTVPDSMRTISNGTLEKSVLHQNRTRSDYWVQDLPHSPYLFALVVGPYQKYERLWRDKSVNYYTLHSDSSNILTAFENTPKMLEFFTSAFGVDFPWDNYEQVPVYDFISGAMENTTASVFHEGLMVSPSDLNDRIWKQDLIVAHELAHHWFGNLVTPVSWSHLTLSESFASFSEVLWLEHWKGKRDADVHWRNRYGQYLNEYKFHKSEPIVQPYYSHPIEIFDRHRYDKGSAVLHLLRQYIGDKAFFAGLKEYLSANAYGHAEISHLRLAFEKVTGEDLHWFFNQWFYNPGHPIVEITHGYNESGKEVFIRFEQTQMKNENVRVPLHKIIVNTDIIFSDTILQKQFILSNKIEEFKLPANKKPLAIHIDPGKKQLWEAHYDYSEEELAAIHKFSNHILDEKFVLDELKSKSKFDIIAETFFADLHRLHWFTKENIFSIANHFSSTEQKGLIEQALKVLDSELPFERNISLKALQKVSYFDIVNLSKSVLLRDSSNLVRSTCLEILSDSSYSDIYSLAQNYTDIRNPGIESILTEIFSKKSNPDDLWYFERSILSILHFYSGNILKNFQVYLTGADDETFLKGLDIIENVIKNEYPNNRVHQSKQVLKNLTSLKIGEGCMNEIKKQRLLEMSEKLL